MSHKDAGVVSPGAYYWGNDDGYWITCYNFGQEFNGAADMMGIPTIPTRNGYMTANQYIYTNGGKNSPPPNTIVVVDTKTGKKLVIVIPGADAKTMRAAQKAVQDVIKSLPGNAQRPRFSFGSMLNKVPLVGGILGGAYNAVSGVLKTAAGVATFGHSGTLASGIRQLGNGLRGMAIGGLDLVGKAWTLPNTAAGLIAGVAGIPFGAKIGFGNNSIQFTHYPWGEQAGAALTLGNVQLYHEGSVIKGPTHSSSRYDGKLGPDGNPVEVNTGRHEQAHTYQYQLFGPFFLPLYFANGGIPDGSHPLNPLERAADDFAEGVNDWCP